MPYTFALAHPPDDPAIRRLLWENPAPGQISLSHARQPDYFTHRPTSDRAGGCEASAGGRGV
ncbi:MAG: hypothetical protein KJZ86_15990 [Caldilineaceae bacterium]|nr:hypothetical protein [Caldilineaceae bacterium]